MNFLSFTSIPLKKTSNHYHLIAKKRGNKKFIVQENVDQVNDITPHNQPADERNSLHILYKPKEDVNSGDTPQNNPSDMEIVTRFLSQRNMAADGDGPVPANGQADLGEDEMIIEDVLDMMEEYGVTETNRKMMTVEEIRNDLRSSSEGFMASFDSLVGLCSKDIENNVLPNDS